MNKYAVAIYTKKKNQFGSQIRTTKSINLSIQEANSLEEAYGKAVFAIKDSSLELGAYQILKIE